MYCVRWIYRLGRVDLGTRNLITMFCKWIPSRQNFWFFTTNNSTH